MDNYGGEVGKEVNRFNENLKLFDGPTPQTYWRATSTTDTISGEEFQSKQQQPMYMAQVVPPSNQSRYSPKTVYNPGYSAVDKSVHVNDHSILGIGRESKPPIPGLGPVGMSGAGGRGGQEGAPKAVILGGSRYPPPKSSNLSVSNNTSMSNATQFANTIGSDVNKTSSSYNKTPGSNYSSPRSSFGSGGDSKNSSPRTSLTNPPPPPPYDQKYTSPRSSLASPRSSVSATSLESKHSSPRHSMTGVVLYDRYPSPRGSLASPHDKPNVLRSGQSYDNHSDMSGFSDGHGGLLSSLGPRAGGSLSDNRFNEPAPPLSFTDSRIRSLHPHHAAIHVVNVHSSPYSNNTTSMSNQSLYGSVQNQNPADAASLAGTFPGASAPATYAGRLPLHYETVPPRPRGPSDAEKKLALLTQKLEDEMRISSPSSKKSPDVTPKEPPPPYHGPHKTEPMPGVYSGGNTFTFSSSVAASQPLMTTPPKNVVNSEQRMSPIGRSPLPYHVTPSPSKGPSEAEKKLAKLTQQLEDEMENNPLGEYYGKSSDNVYYSDIYYLIIIKIFKIITGYIILSCTHYVIDFLFENL